MSVTVDVDTVGEHSSILVKSSLCTPFILAGPSNAFTNNVLEVKIDFGDSRFHHFTFV